MKEPLTSDFRLEPLSQNPPHCEVFQVCKQEKRQGQRKLVQWQVHRLQPEPETQLEHDLKQSIAAIEAAKSEASPEEVTTQALVPVVPQEPAAAASPVRTQNGANHAAAGAAQKNGTTPSAPTTKLEHALKTAISAAHNAEKFGAELGYVVRFDADAIKSMAITVLINMSEGGRR